MSRYDSAHFNIKSEVLYRQTKRFTKWEKPEIVHNQDTKYGWRVSYPSLFMLGDKVDIGYGCYIQAQAGVQIEDNVQIGSHCAIYSVNTEDNTEGWVIIKEGANVGSHTVIFPGVTIGKGATVGAHSLVKTDVPDGETWFGIPAKKYEKWGKYVSGEESHSCRGLWPDRSRDSLSVPGITCGCKKS